MELDSIIKLIETVSASNLTSFQYTEGNISLSFEIKPSNVTSNLVEAPSTVITHLNQQSEAIEDKSKLNTISSPMVGTFYQAKSEDSEPFIQVGDRVKKGQIIGIIEAMKLMNEVESEFDGVVQEIVVKNKDMVEYGQPLVRIKPNN